MNDLLRVVNPVSFKENEFLDLVRKNTNNPLITKKDNIRRFYDFPEEVQHYLFCMERVTFSLVILFLENSTSIQLYLGERPRDYFKPDPKNFGSHKKHFSHNAVMQNNPYLLRFYREKSNLESWTKIQIPNHHPNVLEIQEAVYQIQKAISFFLKNEK